MPEDMPANATEPAEKASRAAHLFHGNGLHHVNVWVFDMDQSIAFYERAFGFRLVFRWAGVEGVRDGQHYFHNPLEGAHLEMGNGQILELVPAPPGASPKDDHTASFNHIGLRVADLEQTYAQALVAGAKPFPIKGDNGTIWDGTTTITLTARPPFERSFVVHAAHVLGPSGEIIELFES